MLRNAVAVVAETVVFLGLLVVVPALIWLLAPAGPR